MKPGSHLHHRGKIDGHTTCTMDNGHYQRSYDAEVSTVMLRQVPDGFDEFHFSEPLI
jgi:hypothetical protein